MRTTNSHPVTGEVIVMEKFRSGKSLSPLKQAEAYWSSLRNGVDIPRRSDIDPRGIENLLEYAFIIERVAPGVARFRLAGQHLSALMGMDVRGMPLTAFFTPQARAHVGAMLENMFEKPAVVELEMKGEARRRRPSYEAKMLLLPLRSDTGEVTRALGVLVSDGPVSTVPARFDVAKLGLRPTNGQAGGHVDLDDFAQEQTAPVAVTSYETPPVTQTPRPAGFAEQEQAPIKETASGKKRPAYLRVVK